MEHKLILEVEKKVSFSWSGYHRSKFLMKSNSMKYWQTCTKKLLYIKGCWARGSWESSGARITETERGTHERKSETCCIVIVILLVGFCSFLVGFVQKNELWQQKSFSCFVWLVFDSRDLKLDTDNNSRWKRSHFWASVGKVAKRLRRRIRWGGDLIFKYLWFNSIFRFSNI